ncbi:hypothetical protein TWF730_003111 [Orbilia blumenaviensis]|uniref:Uncharacterized protein n=1 Tax=Orbilia blumenaviensis TaxID=1796055 RepID=A0AAV9U6Z7_9PEZI
MADFTVDGIVLVPARYTDPNYQGGAEQCGQNKWCLNAPSLTIKMCGTWLGQSDYCCWAIVHNTTNSILQPCDHIPELQGETYDTVGTAAKNATSECPKGTRLLTEYDDRTLACCSRETTNALTYNVPTDDFYEYAFEGYRCGKFTITEIVPEQAAGQNGGGNGDTSGSPTSQAPGFSSTSGSTGGSASGQSKPNSGSRMWSSSSKIASLVIGSTIMAVVLGAQL